MRHLLPAVLSSALLACPAYAQTHAIEGRVFFRERLALPPKAVVQVDLVAHGPGAPRVVASVERTGIGQSPIRFALDVPRATLRQASRHSLSARITLDGRLWFVNAGAVDLPDGPPYPPVDIRVVRPGGR